MCAGIKHRVSGTSVIRYGAADDGISVDIDIDSDMYMYIVHI
jgi:hypothetical protein